MEFHARPRLSYGHLPTRRLDAGRTSKGAVTPRRSSQAFEARRPTPLRNQVEVAARSSSRSGSNSQTLSRPCRVGQPLGSAEVSPGGFRLGDATGLVQPPRDRDERASGSWSRERLEDAARYPRLGFAAVGRRARSLRRSSRSDRSLRGSTGIQGWRVGWCRMRAEGRRMENIHSRGLRGTGARGRPGCARTRARCDRVCSQPGELALWSTPDHEAARRLSPAGVGSKGARSGHDAVTSTASSTNLRGSQGESHVLLAGTGHVIEAMKAHGVRRLVVLVRLERARPKGRQLPSGQTSSSRCSSARHRRP